MRLQKLWFILVALAAVSACGGVKQFNDKEVCGAGGCDACIGAQCPPDAGARDAGP